MAIYAKVSPRTSCPTGGTLLVNLNGDSITNGPVTEGGWRGLLLPMLASARGGSVGAAGAVDSLGGKDNALYGFNVTTCGTSASGYDGTSAQYWVDNGSMAAFNPGTVHFGTLMLGANDPGDSLTTLTNVQTLIDQWFALHPLGVLFVSNRLVRSFAATTTYNAALAVAVAARRTAGQSIVLVDNNSVVSLIDLYDGLHPNNEGNRKIALRYFAAMTPYLRT